jgi:hypothetical protein
MHPTSSVVGDAAHALEILEGRKEQEKARAIEPGARINRAATTQSSTGPLLGLLSLTKPREQAVPVVTEGVGPVSDVHALFSQAAKWSRRQGWFGGPYVVPRDAKADQALSRVKPILNGALQGTAKMTEINRAHIEQMLLANDVPGLKAAAEGSEPLRSFATGLKVGKTLLGREGAADLPETLKQPLEAIKTFYEATPELVALGDARNFSTEKPKSPEQVKALMSKFVISEGLLNNLRKAFLRL